jgi:hypothetical protein
VFGDVPASREQKLKNRLEAIDRLHGVGVTFSTPRANSSNERAVFVPQNTCAWQVLKGNAECGTLRDELKSICL